MAYADVSLEAHDDGAVDGGHHGDLHHRQEVGHEVRVGGAGEERPQVREGVQAQAPQQNQQVVAGHELSREGSGGRRRGCVGRVFKCDYVMFLRDM